MQTPKSTSTLPLHDINLSAYLDYRGIEPALVKENTRIVFCFPNNAETHRLMAEYNQNPAVPILDFISHLRKLRSLMLSQRG
ncbi:MAG: DUF5659 domain-containing protein [Syntrophales bacterium]